MCAGQVRGKLLTGAFLTQAAEHSDNGDFLRSHRKVPVWWLGAEKCLLNRFHPPPKA